MKQNLRFHSALPLGRPGAPPAPGVRSWLVHRGETVILGRFRLPPHDSLWVCDNSIGDDCLIVFPRTAVGIRHIGRTEVVATPNHIMFYNRQQEYRRTALTDRGDDADWIRLRSDVLCDIIRAHRPAVDDDPDCIFPFDHSPCQADAFLGERKLYEHLRWQETLDAFAVEESALQVVARVVANAFGRFDRPARRIRPDTARSRRELTEEAKRILAQAVTMSISLDELSARLHVSPFHLCRVFRCQTGQPIHQYLKRLRLRIAVERLVEPGSDICRLALDVGFASHSHFTDAFRREFGQSPSAYRAAARGESCPKPSKNSEAASTRRQLFSLK